ncbi:hypothetical protein [Actinocrispum wychmicini]|uniref:Uncharacterized protein n=1 Tax=Actinocrispum wychmicini TaxID=1213861 RepID=A0A4R2IVW7_9PSEU|nr:hypothetical protein [Actinocrispum wychmicini]TCO49901.1 hypothetical protein EV192_114271 [Actinocrispum wychmicini]
MSDFFPPPRREMPPEVRDRLRRKLWRELDRPARFRVSRVRAPLAAAISVTVLAAAVSLVAAQSTPTAEDAGPATAQAPVGEVSASGATDHSSADLDRCFNAAKASPAAATFPDRPQWTVSFTAELNGVEVTAARAGGKPLFCESTLTTVTLSNPSAEPAYATGSATGALFATPNGTVAGLTDPSWDTFEITPADGNDAMIAAPEKGDGMFVLYTTADLAPDAHLQAQQLPPDMPFDQPDRPDDDDPTYPIRDIPSVPPPIVSVVDRPAPAERTSTRGKALADCMAGSHDPEPDRDSWQAGAAATVNGNELIMATNAKGVAVCQWQTDSATLDFSEATNQNFQAYTQFVRSPLPVDAAQTSVMNGGDDGLVILGTVRADATKMSVVLDGTTELDTDVKDGTFISIVPDSQIDDTGQLPEDHLATLSTTIYDAKGNELYRGPLNAR